MSQCYSHFDCERTVLRAMPTIFVCCGVAFCGWGGTSLGASMLALLLYITKSLCKVWSLVLTADQKKAADETQVGLSAWDDFSRYFNWNGKFWSCSSSACLQAEPNSPVSDKFATLTTPQSFQLQLHRLPGNQTMRNLPYCYLLFLWTRSCTQASRTR